MPKRDMEIPVAMAPSHPGTCSRCRRHRDIIWPVYYRRTNPLKENMRELCTGCREDCGYGTRWRYAGGGDVVEISTKRRAAGGGT